jgi:Leucine-rich repeat (LRR) protein
VNLSSQHLKELPERLFCNDDFQDRDVSFDQQGTGWWEQVELTRLVAADNSITRIDVRIAELKGLCVLDLHNNHLESLPEELGELENLAILNLSSNQITILPRSIGHLPLVELHLSSNEISQIPTAFGQLKRLAKLDLSRNQLTEMPPALSEMFSLQELNVSYNRIESISCDLNAIHQLRTLNLSHNQLLCFLDNATLRLPELAVLDVKYNQLTDWSCIVDCPKLKDFCLAFNKLRGVQDETLLHCASLEIFDVRDNGIGVLPADVLKMYKLSRLDITNNSISSLPPELSFLKKLNSFHYAGNPLRGLPTTGGLVKLMDHLAKKFITPVEKSVSDMSIGTHSEQQPLPVGSSRLVEWSGMGLKVLDVDGIVESGLLPTSINASNNAIIVLPQNFEKVTTRLQTLLLSKNRFTLFPLFSGTYLTV